MLASTDRVNRLGMVGKPNYGSPPRQSVGALMSRTATLYSRVTLGYGVLITMTDKELLQEALNYLMLPGAYVYIDGVKALRGEIRAVSVW